MGNATVTLPPEYRGYSGIVQVKHEEDAICWLWAFPSVLPWERPVAWLYTPVVGNSRWPGDLWGVDSGGNLLLLEAKHCRRSDDAFKDFLEYHRRGREELSAAHWKAKWKGHLNAEKAFPDATSERPKGKTDGILPRSNKRQHIRRWPGLALIIDGYIRLPAYSRAVEEYLSTRASAGDPEPYYFALMIESEGKSHVLSESSIKSGKKLRRVVGSAHVLAVAIACMSVSRDRGVISARQMAF